MTALFVFKPELSIGFVSISSIYFFFVGCFWGIDKINFCKLKTGFRFALYLLAMLLGLGRIMMYGSNVSVLYELFLIISTWSLFVAVFHLLEKKWLKPIPFLSSTSFFIYGAHSLALTGIAKALLPFERFGEWGLLAQFLIAPLITVALCVLGYLVLKRMSPCLWAVLNGKSISK